MPSTYTVNLGIEKPATGEQSGTWGDTVNDNSNILDEAINGVVSITLASAGSSGSPNSITITNGALSTGRNKWIEFTDGGDLGAAAYVQLTPNDAEKICFIRNSLTASRSIFLFQGTYNASNDLEIAAGTDVVVKFNGGGTGATVVNVYANLKVDGIVATTADINGGTVDGTVIGGAAAAALTATTVVANTSLNIAGTTTISSVLDEDNMASDSATALATQQSIKAYVDSQVGTVDTLSEILVNGNTTGGTDIIASTTDKVQFRDAAIYINSSVDGQLDIVADTEIQIATTTVDINGAVDISGTLGVTGAATFSSTVAGAFNGTLGATTPASVAATTLSTTGGAVFNEGGVDVDFRVESDTKSHMLFVDGGNNQVFIGASSASALNTFGDDLVVVNTVGGTGAGISIIANATDGYSNVYFGDTADGDIGRVQYNHGDNSMTFRTNAADALVIASTGAATFNAGITATTLSTTGAATIQGLTVGLGAGAVSTNTAVGSDALAANTTGGSNVANGYQSLYSNTTGVSNVATGRQALYSNTTGSIT
jgi:hypothetical protein